MINQIFTIITGIAMTFGGWFGFSQPIEEPKIGAFSDPFLSIQLATSPANGECLTTDGTNNNWASCGSSSGSGNVSTSTVPTIGHIPFWATSGATPELLGSVATGTLTAGTGLTIDATRYIIGGSADLDIDTTETLTWSILQNFNYSSTSLYASFAKASSTNWLGGGLTDCDDPVNSKLLWSDTGFFSCGSDQTGAGGTIDGSGTAGMVATWVDSNTITASSTLSIQSFVATSTSDINIFPRLSGSYSSSTLYSSFITASTTNLNIGGDSLNDLEGDGLLVSGSALIFDCSDVAGTGITCSGEDITAEVITAGDHITRTGDDLDVDDDFILNTGDVGTGAYTFPFASTTMLTASNGFISQASSTVVGLLNFPYSSSTVYSSFAIASTSNLVVSNSFRLFSEVWNSITDVAEYIADTAGAMFTGNTETGITVTYQDADNTIDVVCDTASGSVFGCLSSADWTTFNSKLGSYDAWTHPQLGHSATTSSLLVGTSTTAINLSALTIASSSANQLSLSAGAGLSQWVFRNAGGKFYLATTTTAGTATSTQPLISIDENGKFGLGTTTPFKKFSVTGDVQIDGGTAASSTIYIYSTAASKGGSLIVEDIDGAGCTEIYTLNGVISGATVTCPTE